MIFRILGILGFLVNFAFSQWQMFSDTKDTYLYNTQTGEIYIRYHQKGNQNYQDIFVKMPQGMTPQELANQKSKKADPTQKEIHDSKMKTPTAKNHQGDQIKNTNDPLMDSKLESLKKSQEMMNEALKGTF